MVRSPGYGSLVQTGLQELVSQTKGASDPVGIPPISPQAAIPIKAWRPRLHCHCNVAQPQRPPRAVPQHVQAQEAKVVLRGECANVHTPQRHQTRAGIELVDGAGGIPGRPLVQVYRSSWIGPMYVRRTTPVSAASLSNLGNVTLRQKDYEAARSLFEEAWRSTEH